MTWRASVLTLVPEIWPGPLAASVIGRGLEEGAWALETRQIRDFATDKHHTVDDTPAGGGPGMVMRADVLAAAVDAVERAGRPLVHLSPRGAPLTQARARDLAAGPGVVMVASRFEGVDQRFLDAREVEEISIGDFVLAGGDLPAMALIEACVRLLPGVLGAAQSLAEESFEAGLLEHPHYTRPRDFEGREIPDVLLSGDHKRIAAWRREQALEITRARRPDLLAPVSEAERGVLSGADKKNDGETR
ncbi:MAG: tRNA (guanosine(37)-N1)-methyltransferase TrmD [Pseudomonadota bacterium]